MRTLDTIKKYRDQLVVDSFAAVLFPVPPVLDFRPQQKTCLTCKRQLKVLKSRMKSAATLHIGVFSARETLLFCPCDNSLVYTSGGLSRLVQRRCHFGYDVMVYVGQALFLEHRLNSDIIEALAAQNITISGSQIDYLGRKFILSLAIAHRRCADKIKLALKAGGGYILHLDSTCEGNSPMLMTGLDAISHFVLGSVKLPSEKAEKIIPFLRELVAHYGLPLAVVNDMGSGILKAISQVLPDTPNYICHFHFLRDIGRDLLDDQYGIIRNRLKKYGISAKLTRRLRALKADIDNQPSWIERLYRRIEEPTNSRRKKSERINCALKAYCLIQWALDGKKQGHGYGFPFDQPLVVFAQRLQITFDYCLRLKKQKVSKSSDRIFGKLCSDLKGFVSDPVVNSTLSQTNQKIKIFNKLRTAMRIAPRSGSDGLNADGMNVNIDALKKRTQKVLDQLQRQDQLSKSNDYAKTIKQFKKYWDKLFAKPIAADTVNGKVSIQPQRTNNILERFFRQLKRSYRRKTGNNSMNRALRVMLADTPLVKNLQNEAYVQILLDGKANLAELFASIDDKTIREQMQNSATNPVKIPSKIKKVIAKPSFPELILYV